MGFAYGVSGHGFSANGHDWNMSAIEPYDYLVRYTDGGIQPMPTMERPKLIFDPATQELSHLVTGTQYDSGNESQVWPCSINGTCGCQFCKTTAPMDRHVFTLSRPLRSEKSSPEAGTHRRDFFTKPHVTN